MEPSVQLTTEERGGLRAAIAAQWHEAWHWPFEAPLVVVLNAGLFLGAVYLVPPDVRDWLVTLHGPLTFAMLLQSWMVADVPATNVIGSSPALALAALDDPDPDAISDYLLAKIWLMWLLTAPVCAVIALVIGVRHAELVPALGVATALLVVPFPTLAVASWLGVVMPYRQRSLAWRWARRRDWRAGPRWLVLVFLPWFAVPWVGSVLLSVLFLVPRLMHLPRGQRWGPEPFVLGAALVIAASVPVYLIGRRVALALVARRRDALRAYLRDPDAG